MRRNWIGVGMLSIAISLASGADAQQRNRGEGSSARGERWRAPDGSTRQLDRNADGTWRAKIIERNGTEGGHTRSSPAQSLNEFRSEQVPRGSFRRSRSDHF